MPNRSGVLCKAISTENHDGQSGVDGRASDSSAAHWYFIQARVGYESSVVKALQRHLESNHLSHLVERFVVPEEERVDIRGGKKRKIKHKFLPGYILVKTQMNDQLWHLVRALPKAVGFLGKAEHPVIISDQEVDRILHRMEQGETKLMPKMLFEPGEVVRVIEGPFADFNGVVEDVNYDKNRLRVSVLIFGRSTPVELEFGQVEKS